MNMREEILRAVFEREKDATIKSYEKFNPMSPRTAAGLAIGKARTFEYWDPSLRREAEAILNIVLEKLMVPTHEMCSEGYSEACRHDCGHTVPSADIAPETFKAMIRAVRDEK